MGAIMAVGFLTKLNFIGVAPGVVLQEVKKSSVVISRAGVAQELRITKTPATPASPISR